MRTVAASPDQCGFWSANPCTAKKALMKPFCGQVFPLVRVE
ncbi:MAG: hypothetical protein NTW19_12055 [Planctomycetota bacterium]|nr:hypothetical protein [Planctomycetota bacterium]